MRMFLFPQNKYYIFLIFNLISIHCSLLFDAQIIIDEKILEKQLKQGYKQVYIAPGPEFQKPKVTESDLNSTVIIVKDLLLASGFKPLGNQDFSNKINDIFGRIIDYNSKSKYLYINFFDKCDKKMNLNPNNYTDYLGMYVAKDENFVTEFYYIPELIDYKKSYPNSTLENTLDQNSKNENGEEIKISFWKDKANLSEQRQKNIQTLAARNMYLFNDSKPQYKWLIINDQQFMESLVKTFGYTQDPELLKWVIEKTKFDKNDPQNYGKLFWMKKCDGSLKLHANTFKMLQKLYIPKDTSDNRFILSNIQSYLEYLGSEKSVENNLNAEEKVKIMANLAYFAEQYNYNPSYIGGSRIMGRLRFFLNQDDIKILEKNNYFNLPKFKEWWDNADYDEYFVEECEYNGTCGPDNKPMNITEWRKQHPKK